MPFSGCNVLAHRPACESKPGALDNAAGIVVLLLLLAELLQDAPPAGYREGRTAVMCFDLPSQIQNLVNLHIPQNPHFIAGIPWYQGNHTLFLQQGVPALVFASEWFLENLETQTVTHTPRDGVGNRSSSCLRDFV